MYISANFDSGNIDVLAQVSGNSVELAIRKDPGPNGFFQWFHFRAVGTAGETYAYSIENAGQASYTDGWDGYHVCASYDREKWFRVPTSYRDGKLQWSHEIEQDSIYYAYFAPFSHERHQDLISRVQQDPRAHLSVLGQTIDGRDLDLLTIGDPAGAATDLDSSKRTVWMIARQHPGETMAEHWMEGMLERLLDPVDPISRALLDQVTFKVVPNMNPDGSARGHLRTNAAGKNLNRVWAEPSETESPEVFYVDRAMRDVGCDFFLDVHGDEGLPYNFIAGADAVPDIDPKLIDLRVRYEAALRQANPDFQSDHGYPKMPAGKANLTVACSHVAWTHKCLSMTLEMPFKDAANRPEPVQGWSPERCRKLGASCLDALYAVLADLRT